MEQTVKNFKENLALTCQKYDLPTQNKSAFFYILAMKVLENPDNTELRNLLITSVCGSSFLPTNYNDTTIIPEEEISWYEWMQTCIMKLTETLDIERELPGLWNNIRSKSKLPKPDSSLLTSEDIFKEETTHLTYLFRKLFDVSEADSPELYYNLHHFVCITKSDAALRSVAPLFFAQLMTRHKSRLATKECLHVNPNSLWEYKKYIITRNNEKNYKMYNAYFRLFRKLCKFYKKDKDVNIELCKHGFQYCSNIIDWSIGYKPHKVHKIQSKLDVLFFDYIDTTYRQPAEPKEFGIYTAFDANFDTWNHILDKYIELFIDLEIYMQDYLLEHIEYVIDCMYHMYADASVIQRIVKDIYENAEMEAKYPLDVPLNYRLTHIYETLTNMMDRGVEAKVMEARVSSPYCFTGRPKS